MIDIQNEEILSLAQAGRRLPQIRGAKAKGERDHPATIWRWARVRA